MDLLEAGRYYQSNAVIQYVLHNIEHLKFYFHPADLVNCALKSNSGDISRTIFRGAFQRLVRLSIREISPIHERLVGPTVFSALVRLWSAIDEHRRIVACEPPIIDAHVLDCADHRRCAADWQAVWWNGMGRLLLDGRNPQSWDMAVELFSAMDFGEMADGCQKAIMELVRDHVAFTHANTLVNRTCEDLANLLIVVDEGSDMEDGS